MEKILISGGSGMLGSRIAAIAVKEGYEVGILSRSKREYDNYTSFVWDVKAGTIESGAIKWADHIIHLAGAGVADQHWTSKRKREIYNSRIDSTHLLHDKLKAEGGNIQSFVSASAVGFYGDSGDQVLTEEMAAGDDFLADVCKDWEAAAEAIAEEDVRVAIMRIGIVLSMEGGALEKIVQTAKFGLLSYFGDGSMYMPWIHLDDVAAMFLHAVKNKEVKGIYNACAPEPVSNKVLVKTISEVYNGFTIVAPAPEFGLKLALGQLAEAILAGYNTSAAKIQSTGFTYKYSELKAALKALLNQ